MLAAGEFAEEKGVIHDNLALSLAVTKGRGRTSEVNHTCREVLALAQMANVKLVVR